MSSISGQASERASSSKTSHDSRETSTLLSAPSLLQEHHGDALKALHAAVQAHNALAAAETERARVASEVRLANIPNLSCAPGCFLLT